MTDFDLYKTELKKWYEKTKDGENSRFLVQLGQATLRDLCIEVCSERKPQDLIAFKNFLGFDFDENDQKRIRNNTDKFKPMISFLKNKTVIAESKSTEMLAVLIDYPYRPLKKFVQSKHLIDFSEGKNEISESENPETPEEKSASHSTPEVEEIPQIGGGTKASPEIKLEDVQEEGTREEKISEFKDDAEEMNSEDVKEEDRNEEKIPEFEDDLEVARIVTLDDGKKCENEGGENEEGKSAGAESTQEMEVVSAETENDGDEKKYEEERGENPAFEETAELGSDGIEKSPETTTSKSGHTKTPEPPKPRNWRNAVAAAILIAASSAFYFTTIAHKAKECMQWQNYHYELVDCNPSGDPEHLVTPFDSAQFPMRQIKVSKTTTFFVKGEPVVWYLKHDGVYDFFDHPGYHPILKRPLHDISKVIATDVQEGRIASPSEN